MKIGFVNIKAEKKANDIFLENYNSIKIQNISEKKIKDIKLNEEDKYLEKKKILNYLKKIYIFCKQNYYDICIFNFGNGFFLNESLLLNEIKNFEVKEKLFSFRISKTAGVYWNQEPKLPFIDNHFIMMNINEISKVNFFNKKLINYCYYQGSFFNNAVLSSFIEYSLKRNQINNHYYPNRTKNENGNKAYLNPHYFQICEKTSLVTYYKSVKNNDSLFLRNLQIKMNHIKNFNQEENNCYIYKKNIGVNKILKFLKEIISPKYRELGHNEKRIKKEKF